MSNTAAIAAVIEELRSKLAERATPQDYLLLSRRLARCPSIEDARRILADLFVRISDEQFELISSVVAQPFDGSAFFTLISDPFSRRRSVVVAAAFERLVGIVNQASVTATEARNAIVPFSVICDQCDFTRVAPKERAADERQLFLTMLNTGDGLSFDDFQAFYRGQNKAMGVKTDDLAFELLLTRTWNLDRPAHALTAAQSLAASKCSASLTASSTSSSSRGREHPLYQTSAQQFGKNLDQALPPPTKFNRTGEFTKREPLPQPSSGLNTATTRPRYM